MIKSHRLLQYTCECDACTYVEYTQVEAVGISSKQDARKYAGLHKIKDGRDLCDECFKAYKNGELL